MSRVLLALLLLPFVASYDQVTELCDAIGNITAAGSGEGVQLTFLQGQSSTDCTCCFTARGLNSADNEASHIIVESKQHLVVSGNSSLQQPQLDLEFAVNSWVLSQGEPRYA